MSLKRLEYFVLHYPLFSDRVGGNSVIWGEWGPGFWHDEDGVLVLVLAIVVML